jgi:TadE-like protein
MTSLSSQSRPTRRRAKRRGMAAVELALLLPLLVFACMVAVDFARVVYAMVALQNCARNGALYEFYKAAGYSLPSGWTSLSTAVEADAGNLTVTVPSTYGSNSNPYSPASSSNNYVTVTAQCNFSLITLGSNDGLPSIGSSMTLTQSASMPMPASTGTVP